MPSTDDELRRRKLLADEDRKLPKGSLGKVEDALVGRSRGGQEREREADELDEVGEDDAEVEEEYEEDSREEVAVRRTFRGWDRVQRSRCHSSGVDTFDKGERDATAAGE